MAMSIRSSMSSPCSFRHLQASVLRPSCLSNNHRDRCHFLGNRSFLQPLIIKVESEKKMAVVVNSVEPGTPHPSDPSDTDWKPWLVGMLFSVAIRFWKNKWGPLQEIEETLEAVAWFAMLGWQLFIEAFKSKVISELEERARSKARKKEARKQELEVEEVEKKVDSIIEQASKNIEEENDTEDQTAKIKDGTEIKTKIAENKETNAVKKE